MARAIWGLDLGDWALKVVRGSYDKKTGTITVDLFDEIVYGELPCGYEASSQEKHREGIIAFAEKHEIGPRDDLCVAVSGSEVFSRFINLPPVLERIDDIIRYEARQQIPFDIDEVVWDYQPVKEDHEIGEEVECGLFALKRERVQELTELLEPWRRNLRVVQNAPLAVYNLLEYEGLVVEPAIVVDVGAATTDVLVLNPPRFWVRTLLVAGDDLTNALVEQFGISNAEAETIKRRAARSAHREQILRVLQPVFDDLTNEIQRSLGYYKSLAREARFERALALGSALKMTGLTQMLAAGLQYQVQTIPELTRIQLADSVDKAQFGASLRGCCAALGLLVQGAGQSRVKINMVPEDVAFANAISTKKPWLLAAAVGLLVATGTLLLGERLHAQEFAAADQGIDWQAVDRAEKLDKEYSDQDSKLKKVERRLQFLAREDIGRDVFLRVLPAFTQALPDEVYVSSVTFNWTEFADASKADAGDKGSRGRRPAGAARAGGPGGGPPSMATIFKRGDADSSGSDAKKSSSSSPSKSSEAEPAQAGKSVLVLSFSGESADPSKEFVKDSVFGALRRTKFPGEDTLAFIDVQIVGDVRDVYRDRATLQQVAGPADDVERFLAFDGYAVVNAGAAARAAKPKGGGG